MHYWQVLFNKNPVFLYYYNTPILPNYDRADQSSTLLIYHRCLDFLRFFSSHSSALHACLRDILPIVINMAVSIWGSIRRYPPK